MKLWSKGSEPEEIIERFTVGNDRELDMRLARYDVQGSLAHIAMLESIGLLTSDELSVLTAGLEHIAGEIERGEFTIEPGVEDVHSQVEFLLTERLGDVGKKIHCGRSRNDQVLVDLKLLARDDIRDIARAVMALFDVLQKRSEQTRDCLMPGYTHMQVAMPSSFGLWFGAYAETLIDDVRILVAAYGVADQNPLGSAAGYGSSFPLDREMTTRLLGFRTLHFNSVAAQMSRGKTERAMAAAIAAIASTVARLAMDVCMFMCQNFALVSLPDSMTTGSSIMPHKKNPDLFEILRGRCNRLQSLPGELALLTANLPLGYNRDLQLMKDILFPATGELIDCLDMCTYAIDRLKVNEKAIEAPLYDYLFTVEEVNRRVMAGEPFRDAYRHVGQEVEAGTFHAERSAAGYTHAGSIGRPCNDEIREKMLDVISHIL
ncbi:MAG: argininosuccinate lyase [Muribaculaceae bacterium]|nr:argininosuccinate lyase [Muribaculaceae bacterium]